MKDRAAGLSGSDDLLAGRLPEGELALLGYGLADFLMSDLGRYTRLLQLLADGQEFDAALAESYGAPAPDLAQTWLARASRRRCKLSDAAHCRERRTRFAGPFKSRLFLASACRPACVSGQVPLPSIPRAHVDTPRTLLPGYPVVAARTRGGNSGSAVARASRGRR